MTFEGLKEENLYTWNSAGVLIAGLSQTIIEPKFLNAGDINVLEPITNPNHKHNKKLVQKKCYNKCKWQFKPGSSCKKLKSIKQNASKYLQ